MAETRMIAKLKATSAVTDLVSTRIRPLLRKQGAALPAITYQRISTIPCNASVGEANVAWARVQVNSFASTYAGAKALAAAVKACLSGWTDTGGSPSVIMSHWEGDSDLPEDVQPGQDLQVHGVAQEYLIEYGTA